MLGVLGTVAVQLGSWADETHSTSVQIEREFSPTRACLSWNASLFEQLRKGGSLSALQAEPGAAPFSLGMFRKCEWWSVPRAARCRRRLDELQSVPPRLGEGVFILVWVRARSHALHWFPSEGVRECCKPVICVVPSLAMCGPVRSDQKIHGKNRISSQNNSLEGNSSRPSKPFSSSFWRFQKCKNICAETLEEILKVEMFLLPPSRRRAPQLQCDHAGGGSGGAHRHPNRRLHHRHPGVQAHLPQQDGEAHLPGRRVRDHRRPHSLQCGREHPGRKYPDTWEHCTKEEQTRFILAGNWLLYSSIWKKASPPFCFCLAFFLLMAILFPGRIYLTRQRRSTVLNKSI